MAGFHSKIHDICRRTPDNFFLHMYSGQVLIATLPPFQRPDYNHCILELGDCVESVPHTYTSGRSFLQDLKLLVAQISMKDWAPIDEKRVSMLVGLLRQHLPAAVAAGKLEGMPVGGGGEEGGEGCALRCFETGQVVEDNGVVTVLRAGVDMAEVEGGNEEDGSALETACATDPDPVQVKKAHEGGGALVACHFKDEGVELVYKEDGRPVHELLRALQERFESVVPRTGQDDDEWHDSFEAFIQEVMRRRQARVLAWLDVNVANYSNDGNVQKLRADASDMLVRLPRACRCAAASASTAGCGACWRKGTRGCTCAGVTTNAGLSAPSVTCRQERRGGCHAGTKQGMRGRTCVEFRAICAASHAPWKEWRATATGSATCLCSTRGTTAATPSSTRARRCAPSLAAATRACFRTSWSTAGTSATRRCAPRDAKWRAALALATRGTTSTLAMRRGRATSVGRNIHARRSVAIRVSVALALKR